MLDLPKAPSATGRRVLRAVAQAHRIGPAHIYSRRCRDGRDYPIPPLRQGPYLDGAREHLRKNRRDTMRIHEAVKRLRAVRDRLTAILGALDERQRRQRAALFAAKAAEEAEKKKG